MFRFEDLEIWALAIKYGNRCYDIANSFPDYETYALSSQLRRASISISIILLKGVVLNQIKYSVDI